MPAPISWLPTRAAAQTERGASTVEVGILTGVVAVVMLTFVTTFFDGIGSWLASLINLLPIF